MTRLQRRLYDFIDAYWREHGFAPTYQIMADGIGQSSKTGIHRLVHLMAEEGYLEIRHSRYRSVKCIAIGTKDYQAGYAAGYADALEKAA
jgi:SOS-response transcriptional repressor LexA